jgi:pimeloyl-ACP methyl ester carboxylesterase
MAHAVSNMSRSSLEDLWASMEAQNEPEVENKQQAPVTSAFLSSSIQSSVRTVNWVIENRGGFAWLTGLVMVPSQFLGPKAAGAKQVIADVAESNNFQIGRFSLPVKDTDTSIEGVIYYPRGWNQSDRSRCVLYHNPNGITASGYFEDGHLAWTPAEILKLAKCPILMYDYRGTGLSSENICMSSLAFRPTYETVVVDGQTALDYALKNFRSVSVVGSSLGGGVATVSLERHLKAHPEDAKRVRLTNHDSFSTTPKVVMPGWPRTANWAGWLLGGLLDAETSMKSLIGREIPITVLCHDQDPVIPQGARMAEFIETLPRNRNVSVIHSPEYGHANLSQDMASKLGQI